MQSRPSQTRYCARIHCRANSRLIFSSSISNFKTIFFWWSCPHQSKLNFNVLRCQKKTREAFFRFEDFYFILVSLFPEIRFYIATFNLKFHFENCFCLFRVDIGEFLKKWQRIKNVFVFGLSWNNHDVWPNSVESSIVSCFTFWRGRRTSPVANSERPTEPVFSFQPDIGGSNPCFWQNGSFCAQWLSSNVPSSRFWF